MPIQRPTGVTVLAVLQFIGGVLSLLFGVLSLFFGGAMVATDAAEAVGAALDMGPGMVVVGISSIIIGIIGLIAGYGLFTLKGWGWLLAVGFSLSNIVRNIMTLFIRVNVVGAITGIVISELIFYYLYQPNVKRAFGKA